MNLPNALTLSRFGMAALMMACLFLDFPFARTAALTVFVLAAITDAVDGRLARRVYGVTAFGALLDPLADKVLVCAAFVSFVELRLVPAWIAVLILTREFLVTGLRVLAGSRGQNISAAPWGKHKTAWQIAAIALLLAGLALRADLLPRLWPSALGALDDWFPWTAYALSLAVAAVTVLSGAIYFHQHRDLIAEHLQDRPREPAPRSAPPAGAPARRTSPTD